MDSDNHVLTLWKPYMAMLQEIIWTQNYRGSYLSNWDRRDQLKRPKTIPNSMNMVVPIRWTH